MPCDPQSGERSRLSDSEPKKMWVEWGYNVNDVFGAARKHENCVTLAEDRTESAVVLTSERSSPISPWADGIIGD